jgi:hypothetical protein
MGRGTIGEWRRTFLHRIGTDFDRAGDGPDGRRVTRDALDDCWTNEIAWARNRNGLA